MKLDIMVMSGVDDGLMLHLDSERDGQLSDDSWVLSIGRREESDIVLRHDTFVSRDHARLHWRDQRWWLEDCQSKNGTFIEGNEEDVAVTGTVPLAAGQLFRIGRTWLRIQPSG